MLLLATLGFLAGGNGVRTSIVLCPSTFVGDIQSDAESQKKFWSNCWSGSWCKAGRRPLPLSPTATATAKKKRFEALTRLWRSNGMPVVSSLDSSQLWPGMAVLDLNQDEGRPRRPHHKSPPYLLYPTSLADAAYLDASALRRTVNSTRLSIPILASFCGACLFE